MKKQFKNLFRLMLIMLVVTLTNCQKDDMLSGIIEQQTVQPSLRIENVTKDFINQNAILKEKLSMFSPELVKNQSDIASRLIYNEAYDFTIDTENAIYIESGNYHSYTFSVYRDNSELVENLLLSLKEIGVYEALLVSYDLNDDEKTMLLNSQFVSVSEKMVITSIDLDINEILNERIRENEDGTCDEITETVGPLGFPVEQIEQNVPCPDQNNEIDAGDSSTGGGSTGVGIDYNGNTDPNTNTDTDTNSGSTGETNTGSETGGETTTNDPITTPKISAASELINILDLSNMEDADLILWINANQFSDSGETNDITEIYNFLVANSFSELAIKEARLTLNTLASDVPWTPNVGSYNGITSLSYTDTRTIVINGTPLAQFKLVNGDRLSGGNYALCQGCSESEDRLYYFSQQSRLWYEIPNPSNYTPLNLDFLWEGFWDSVQVGVRYCTPLEDIIILIEGEDFDGVEQSRAVAAGFILLEIIPGSDLIKLVKVVKYGDEAIDVANAIRKYVDDAYKAQKQIIDSVVDGVDWFDLDMFGNTIRKGNFGEMVTDVDLYSKGYTPKHSRITDLDQEITQGIDGVFQNPETGEFIITESKYNTSQLGNTIDGPQMSDGWIEGGDRLVNAVGEDLASEILEEGYTSVLAKISPNGYIEYFELDEFGQILGEWIP